MDRSSNAVKIEKVRRALETKNYDTALAIAKTVDSARIKSAADLSVVAEAYDKNGIYDTALVYYEQIYLKSKTRRILIHLINLCLKLSMADMAELYLRDFSEMAPRDFYRCIFRYHIDKLREEDIEVLIYDLEELKAENFMEDWAYELAKLYHKSGQSEKCISECNDIILWFGSGMYVERARALRAIHLSRLGKAGDNTEAGIAKEVYRLIDEGKSMQELENFIEEATLPEGNAHYSEEEYNQERFGKPPVYDEEGKDVIWNTREFGAVTEEMIQQQNTMDLLQGMQVAQQLRMHIGAGQEIEIEKPEETAFAAEEPGTGDEEEQKGFILPKTEEYWDTMHPKPGRADDASSPEQNTAPGVFSMRGEERGQIRQEEAPAREGMTEQELYRMLEQNESEEELSKAIRKLTVDGEEEPAQNGNAQEKQATKRFLFWRRAAERKEEKETAAAKERAAAETGIEKEQAVPALEGEALSAGASPEEEPFGRKAGQETAWKKEGGEPEPAAAQKPASALDTFRTGAKILTARVGFSGSEQNAAKPKEPGEAEEVVSFAREEKAAKPEPEATKRTGETKKAESEETGWSQPDSEEFGPDFRGFSPEYEFEPEPESKSDSGFEPKREPESKSGFEPKPEPESESEFEPESESEPESEFGFEPEPEPESEFEFEPEPEPLYEYPEEIMADYAKEAPTLDARLKDRGMKVEEFFGGFLASPDLRRQIFRCMEQILTGRSRAINIIVTGEEKSGKTTLAKAITKCAQVLGGIPSPRVALIRGDKLNHIHLLAKKDQLRGSTMLVEKASLMSGEKVEELLDLNGELAGETAVILEDERSHMNMFLRKNDELVRVYNSRIDLPEKTSADLFLQALSMLYQNEYTMTESVAGEFLGAVRDCIQENPENGYDAVCEYTRGVLKRAEKRMAQMLREFALDGKYQGEELTMLREEDLYGKDD